MINNNKKQLLTYHVVRLQNSQPQGIFAARTANGLKEQVGRYMEGKYTEHFIYHSGTVSSSSRHCRRIGGEWLHKYHLCLSCS